MTFFTLVYSSLLRSWTEMTYFTLLRLFRTSHKILASDMLNYRCPSRKVILYNQYRPLILWCLSSRSSCKLIFQFFDYFPCESGTNLIDSHFPPHLPCSSFRTCCRIQRQLEIENNDHLDNVFLQMCNVSTKPRESSPRKVMVLKGLITVCVQSRFVAPAAGRARDDVSDDALFAQSSSTFGRKRAISQRDPSQLHAWPW